ncbi:MAG: APC family permease [Haloglomus sp.]
MKRPQRDIHFSLNLEPPGTHGLRRPWTDRGGIDGTRGDDRRRYLRRHGSRRGNHAVRHLGRVHRRRPRGTLCGLLVQQTQFDDRQPRRVGHVRPVLRRQFRPRRDGRLDAALWLHRLDGDVRLRVRRVHRLLRRRARVGCGSPRPPARLAVAGFVGLNLAGARTTGSAENVLVALKVFILLAFGVLGLVYALGFSPRTSLRFGFGSLVGFGPIVAAAISFVAFQGWQLLFYDQESISNPVETLRKAVYISIPAAVVIYVLVGVVTVNLAPQALQQHPHVALKDAARTMMSPYGLATVGGVLLALSALFSTGSAINATMFSTAHFAKGMLADDLLPDDIGDADAEGVPERTLLVIGGVTAVFTALGTLSAITSFASLAFILIFGSMSYLALRERDHDAVSPVPPVVGFVGAMGFLPLMAYNLYTREPGTFYMVVAIAVLVVLVELLYFEREVLEEKIIPIEEERIDGAIDGVEDAISSAD